MLRLKDSLEQRFSMQRTLDDFPPECCTGPTDETTGGCVGCGREEHLRWYALHCFRTSETESESFVNGAAAVRHTTYVNRTSYDGLVNISTQICDRCVRRQQVKTALLALTIFATPVVTAMLTNWRSLLLVLPLLLTVSWLIELFNTTGERVAAKRLRKKLARIGFPYTRPQHVQCGFSSGRCNPPDCNGPVLHATSSDTHTVTSF